LDAVRLSVMGPVIKAVKVTHEPSLTTIGVAVKGAELEAVLELAMGLPGVPSLPSMK